MEITKGWVGSIGPIEQVCVRAFSGLVSQTGVVEGTETDLEIDMFRGAGENCDMIEQMHQIKYVESYKSGCLLILVN